jgi:putative ABC transport system substrate-binding protein
MRRREFITVLGSVAAAWPLAARAQQPDRMRRIAVLAGAANNTEGESRIAAFRDELRRLGWREGSNVQLDVRWVGGDANRIPGVAAELIRTRPNAILAIATPALVALRRETDTIPIVFVNVSDPVDGGFVDSMARPGGNITGFTSFEYSIGGKWLELLKEAAPALNRVMILLNPENYTSQALRRTIESAALPLGIRITAAGVRKPADIEAAMTAFGREAGGVIVLPDPLTTVQGGQIVGLALSMRLPTIHTFRYFAADGGLMSYGTDLIDLFRRAAGYVDRILKGAEIGQLPVQNPTRYQLVINLKTAKALGLEVPPILLARADEVIE